MRRIKGTLYKSLHASRAVAATLVVLFHLGGAIAADKYFGLHGFRIPFSFGNAGVEFFFVLSGFIILSAHRGDIGRPERLITYARKRILRIYPGYWVAFAALYLVAMLVPSWRAPLLTDPVVVAKALLLLPQDKAVVGGTGAPLIIVAWTLHYEMLFYACFALLILSRWIGAALALAVLLVLVWFWRDTAPPFPYSFLAQDYILLFAMGLAVRHYQESWLMQSRPSTILAIGLATAAIVALDTISGLLLFKSWATLIYGAASSMIVLGLIRAEKDGSRFGTQAWMQTLGDASYALYLIHFPLISALCKVAMMLQLNRLGFTGALIAFLIILAACLMAAVAFHRFVEKPAANFLRALIDRTGAQARHSPDDKR